MDHDIDQKPLPLCTGFEFLAVVDQHARSPAYHQLSQFDELVPREWFRENIR
jgi:hypothetical protein